MIKPHGYPAPPPKNAHDYLAERAAAYECMDGCMPHAMTQDEVNATCRSACRCTTKSDLRHDGGPGDDEPALEPGVEQCPVCGDKYITHEDSPDRQSPDCPHNLIKGACGTVPHDGVLDDAKRIINGDRRGQYGPVENSFKCIADMWTAYIQMRYPAQTADVGPVVLSARDVAIMMVLFKCARQAFAGSRDGWVDICGYAALGADLD